MKALYLRYRPQTWDDLVGQQFVVTTLRNQVIHDRVSHAYLFYGMRGTGKTTLARMLAMAVNCTHSKRKARPCGECVNCMAIKNGEYPDVVEVDAATNRGIDNIRNLRDTARYAPAAGFRKVYIIDECHQLSGAAADGLLKTLEEPVATTMFILATTAPLKVTDTIKSRCQRYNFAAIPMTLIQERLEYVSVAEGADIPVLTLNAIARAARGSVRDGLSLLDMLLQAGVTSPDAVRGILGKAGREDLETFTELIIDRNVAGLLNAIDAHEQTGIVSIAEFRRDLVDWFRELIHAKVGRGDHYQAASFTLVQLVDSIKRLTREDPYYATMPRLGFELAVMDVVTRLPDTVAVDFSKRDPFYPELEAEELAGTAPHVDQFKDAWEF